MYSRIREPIWRTISNKFMNKIKYFGDQSCLHGVGYVFSMKHIPFFKRLFWLLMLILCGLGAAVILRGTLEFISEGTVSFSVETTFLDFDTAFPAVTVCESKKNAKRIRAFLASKNLAISLNKFYEDICYWQSEFCRSCQACTNEASPEHCSNDIQEMVEDYRMKCEMVLSNECQWGDTPFSCCDRFRPIQTEYGVCFVFNSVLTDDKTHVRYLNRRTGLKALQFTAAVDHISVKIHSPDDVVYADSDKIDIPSNKQFEIILKAEQTVSEQSVQSVPAVIRGCLLSNERPVWAPTWPFSRYSHSACNWYCRIMAEIEVCNCTHHFEPDIDGVNKCDFKGLWCLSTKKYILVDAKCPCAMACDEVEYTEIHRFVTNKKSEESKHTVVTVRLSQLPSLRVKRHVIRDMLSFVVDIGGVGGVFFGASLLSVIEIVYLFCIRRNR